MEEILRNKTCCLTGHRDVPVSDIPSVLQRTEAYIRKLYRHGVCFFGVGGAVGYDTLAADLLFRLRGSDLPQIRVILVYPFEGFTSRWSDRQKAEYIRLFNQYNKVICMAANASREAYLVRDRHLADHSSCCICYCTRNNGGTAYTVLYALQKGLYVLHTAQNNDLKGKRAEYFLLLTHFPSSRTIIQKFV